MTNLLRCPFCKGEPVIQACDWSGRYYTDPGEKMYMGREMTHELIVCKKCKVRTHPFLTRKHLENAWNRRSKV